MLVCATTPSLLVYTGVELCSTDLCIVSYTKYTLVNEGMLSGTIFVPALLIVEIVPSQGNIAPILPGADCATSLTSLVRTRMPSSPPPPRIVVFRRSQPRQHNPPCTEVWSFHSNVQASSIFELLERSDAYQFHHRPDIHHDSTSKSACGQGAWAAVERQAASSQGNAPPVERENNTTAFMCSFDVAYT